MIDGHLEQVPMVSILERAHLDREALSCWPLLNVFTVDCPAKKISKIALLVHGYNSALCDTVENFKVVGKLGVQASYALKNAFVLCSLLAVFL